MKPSASLLSISEDARQRWSIPKSARPGWETCRLNWWRISSKALHAALAPMYMRVCFTDAPATTRSKRCSKLLRERSELPARATAGWDECCRAPRDFYDRYRGLRRGQSEFG